MVFDCISIFTGMFASISNFGITERALQLGLWQLYLWDLRDFTTDPYRRIDDRPFGGGPGMVMLAEPLAAAVNAAKERQLKLFGKVGKVIYLSPQGMVLNEQLISEWSDDIDSSYILICGRYEGLDQRFIDDYVDCEISLGDYVVSGGELPAMILIDSLVRRLPQALGDASSAMEDSFVNGLLDYPQFTRPNEWQGKKVPDVLLSGHHENIRRWRLEQSLKRTRERRPDLINAWQTQS